MSHTQNVVLKSGRDKPVRQGHPWIFSGAIDSLPTTQDGDLVPVVSQTGEWLAWGFLNRRSQIQVRLVSWDQGEVLDDTFWTRRLQQAIDLRTRLLANTSTADSSTTAYRLVNGESDDLPGLVVDRYGDYLVLQAGILAMNQRKSMLAELLQKLTGCRGIVERSDMTVRSQEGLKESVGVLVGQPPAGPVQIMENGLHFHVDLLGGQKTGFYTDQRENRRRVAAYCRGARVLNGFSYTGGFGVYALAAGADSLVNVDTSYDALALGEENLALNGFDPDSRSESLAGNLFEVLREWREMGDDFEPFDLIVLDPPKFAQNRQGLDSALRGYKDVNRLAMHLLKPGGILATFSCSGLVSPDLFQKVIFGAALDAGRSLQILEWLRQGTDHPVAITFPEGAYLKGLICRAR